MHPKEVKMSLVKICAAKWAAFRASSGGTKLKVVYIIFLSIFFTYSLAASVWLWWDSDHFLTIFTIGVSLYLPLLASQMVSRLWLKAIFLAPSLPFLLLAALMTFTFYNGADEPIWVCRDRGVDSSCGPFFALPFIDSVSMEGNSIPIAIECEAEKENGATDRLVFEADLILLPKDQMRGLLLSVSREPNGLEEALGKSLSNRLARRANGERYREVKIKETRGISNSVRCSLSKNKNVRVAFLIRVVPPEVNVLK
jgi:hypothetical protein